MERIFYRYRSRIGGKSMSIWELFVIAVGLSMDAFAVSICKGLSVGLSLIHISEPTRH